MASLLNRLGRCFYNANSRTGYTAFDTNPHTGRTAATKSKTLCGLPIPFTRTNAPLGVRSPKSILSCNTQPPANAIRNAEQSDAEKKEAFCKNGYLVRNDAVNLANLYTLKTNKSKEFLLHLTGNRALKKSLGEQFDGIVDELANLDQELRNKQFVDEDLHRLARDRYSRIRHICEKATSLIPSKDRNKFPTEEIYNFFSNFGQLSNELKRHHYTHAVHVDIQRYADKTTEEKKITSPGLYYGREGSDQRIINEGTAGVKYGFHLSDHFTVGPGGSLRLAKERKNSVDDDGDDLESNLWTASLRLGGFLKIAVPHFLLNLVAACKLSATMGTYSDHKNQKESIKARLVRNGKSWFYFRRSGDTDSFGAKYAQKVASAAYQVKTLFYTGRGRPRRGHEKPLVNADKLIKGVQNAPKIAELTARLFDDGDDVHSLTKNVYDRTEGGLQGLGKAAESIASGTTPNPDMTGFNALTAMTALSSPCGSNRGYGSIKRLSMGSETSATLKFSGTKINDKFQGYAYATAGISTDVTKSKTKLKRLKFAHEHLDPGYNNDIEKSRQLIADMDAERGDDPKLHYSRYAANEILKVKRQHNSGPGATNAVNDICNDQMVSLAQKFESLVKIAGVQRSLQDINYRKSRSNKVKINDQGELEKFISEVFGVDSNSGGKKKAFYKKLISDPEFLMIESHDALSITLGRIGVQITETKILQHTDKTARDLVLESTIRKKTGALYSYLADTMSQIYLPIDREVLMRGARFNAKSVAKSTIKSDIVEGMAGIFFPSLQNISGNGQDPLSSPSTGIDNRTGVGNPAPSSLGKSILKFTNITTIASIGLKCEAICRKATKHPNFLRVGEYFQLRETVRQGGLLALLAEHKTTSGSTRATGKKKIGRRSASYSYNDRTKSKSNLRVFLTKGILRLPTWEGADLNVESEIFTGHRKPPCPDGKKLDYEVSTQFTRYIGRTSNSIGAAISAPLYPIGQPIIPYVSGSRSRILTNVNLEIMGDCPSHHILVYPQLVGFMKEATAGGDKGWDGTTPATQEDFNALMAAFTSGEGNASYMLHKCFGNPLAISGVLQKYSRYCGNDCDPRPSLGKCRSSRYGNKPRTEFDRFDDDKRSRETMASMATAVKFSARASEEEFSSTKSADPRPTLTVEEKNAISLIHTYLEAHQDQTPLEIMKYFLGQVNSQAGQAFQIYCRVNAAYDEISSAIKSRNTYETGVQKKRHRKFSQPV